MNWWLHSFRFRKRPSPVVVGILLGLIPAPAFFIMDQVLPISSFYVSFRELGSHWHYAIHNLRFNAQVTESARFIFHQLFFIGMILGALISGWLFGVRPKIMLYFSFREIVRLGFYCLTAMLGGFLFYFGLMWIMLERFDYWQLATGLFQLSLSAWIICLIALLSGMLTVFVIDKVHTR